MNYSGSVVVSRPAAPTELVLLLHGVGAWASNLVPLAQRIAQARPTRMVPSVEGPFASGFGSGRQWFSVQGITEANRPARIAGALPVLAEAIASWQAEAGVAPERPTLVGFSQGAIMALESTQQGPTLAGRIVSIAGRFAKPVRRATAGTVFHFIHGAQDGVIPPRPSIEAAEGLRQLGAQVTIDVLPALGHGIDGRVSDLVRRANSSPPSSSSRRP